MKLLPRRLREWLEGLRGSPAEPRQPERTSRRGRAAHAVGLWGEELAERLLVEKRFRILGRRVRVGRRDEIDLVARDGSVLVFVEVKARRSEDFGRAVLAVDRAKRLAQSRAAVRYLRRLSTPRVCFRFDVVEVIGEPDDPNPRLRHIPDAFHLDRRYSLPA